MGAEWERVAWWWELDGILIAFCYISCVLGMEFVKLRCFCIDFWVYFIVYLCFMFRCEW